MERRLGRSNIRVSALGLGTARIGGLDWQREDGPVRVIKEDVDAAIGAIHRALDLGINFFDTADVYGDGHSERILGRALTGRRERAVIATKFGGQYDAGSERPAGFNGVSPAFVRRACEESLRRLQTDYIDLYLLHIRDYPLERAGELIRTLEELVEQGKIRAYGWSTDDVTRARYFATHGPHCAALEHRLNIFMDAPEMLVLCDEFDLAGINRIPLAMGLLTGRWRSDTELPKNDWRTAFFGVERFRRDLETARALAPILTADGRTYVQGALGWIWARSSRTIPVPGFRTVAHVEEDAAALAAGPLTRKHMRQIEQMLERR